MTDAATSTTDPGAEKAASAASRAARFAWARHPEFWVILLVAALLRLWSLDHAQWLDDQAQLLALARDAWLRGALPITGIRSSIGTLNPPLSVYILMPFFLFTRSPLPALVALALWNIFGVALCYLFGLRYFNRRVAFIAALVFACCGAAVNYSRFIWQQNYLPPLLLLWAFTLYLGVVRGRRPWLALHLLLLAMIIALHPTGLTLLAVTVVALLIAPHWPTRRDTLVGVGLVVLLLLPTILWELLSGFSDVGLLRAFTGQPSVVNGDVFLAFNHLLGAPAYPDPGRNVPYPAILPAARYARLAGWNAVLQIVVSLLYITCYLVLSVLALAPLRRVRPSAPAVVATGWRRVWNWLLALRHALQADARWRAYALLWLWLTIPPLTMLRHGKTVQPHYLFILYPALFLSVGVAVDAIIREGPRLLSLLRIRWPAALPDARRVIAGAALALVLLVALAQGTQTALFLAAVSNDQVSNVNFGYPLNQLLAADGALASIQRQQRAHAVVVSMPSRYTASALTSTLIREESDRSGIGGDCLVLPAPASTPALLVSTAADSPQARLLATLPNASHVQDYAMPGNEPLVIYRVTGQTPLLPDERALPQATWQSGDGGELRLVAEARPVAGVIRLRWTVGQWTIPHTLDNGAAPTTPQYEVQVKRPAAPNADEGAPLARATCQPTGLQPGDTLFTWVTSAWNPNGTDYTQVAPPLPNTPLALTVLRGTQGLWQGSAGPLHVLAGAAYGAPLAPMATSAADTGYQLPASQTGSGAP